MQRTGIIAIVVLLSLALSGCVISKSPSASSVTVAPGATITFSVNVFPSGGTYAWTLDGTALSTTTNSYQYTPTGGEHTLIVTAKHLLGTDTLTWHIIDAEVAATISSAGGTVAVEDDTSPIVGAQVDIPAEALSSTQTITISQVTLSTTPASYAVGPCVDFGPEGTEFSASVDIYLPYNDADDDGKVDGTGISEAQVKAWYYNTTTGTWEDVAVLDIDTDRNIVHISSTHFSTYTTTADYITWNRTWGESDIDCVAKVQQTSDDGYIIIQRTYFQELQYYNSSLIKLDADGNQEWETSFEGSALSFYYAYSMYQTSDGDFIVVGGHMVEGDVDKTYGWMVKVDGGGNIIWEKEFDFDYSGGFASVQQTSDGGYILAGTIGTSSGTEDALLCKTDADGNLDWYKTFGGTLSDWANSIQQTSDGGYILAGQTDSYGSGGVDAWLIKTDAAGNLIWDKTFGGVAYDYVNSVQQTLDGGYILAGTYNQVPGYHDGWLIKTDSSGELVWDKKFGGVYNDEFFSVIQTDDEGYATVGFTMVGENQVDALMLKTDAQGNMLWEKYFGDAIANQSCFYDVQQTSDGGYVLAGGIIPYDATNAEAWLIKTDPDGNAPATSTP